MTRYQRRNPNYGQKNLNRPHYVYRLFDEQGVLLYVGCTMEIFQRFEQHAGRVFWPHVHHADVRGPWDRPVALSIEKQAIDTEFPFFNCTLERDRSRRAYSAAVRNAMAADGYVDDVFDDAKWNAYCDAREQYEEQVRITHPPMDDRDLIDLYLRSKAVRAA